MEHFSHLEIVLIELWPVFLFLFLITLLAIYWCTCAILDNSTCCFQKQREEDLENGQVQEEIRQDQMIPVLMNNIDDELYFSTSSDSGSSANDVECSICLRPIKLKRTIDDFYYAKIIPCGHKFHRLCLESWENRGNSDCPNCRTSFFIDWEIED